MLLNGEDPISLDARRVLLQAVTHVTGTLPGFVGASDALLAGAADLARRAGSVSHDGEAIYGAQVMAARKLSSSVSILLTVTR